MTVFEIALSQTLPRYTQRVVLDGVTFTLSFRFNTRFATWFLDSLDAEEEPIVVGLPCRIDTDLIGQHRHVEDSPQGAFVPYDTTIRKEDPGLSDFGTRVLLLYFDATEQVIPTFTIDFG